jgi:hypothetical protein
MNTATDAADLAGRNACIDDARKRNAVIALRGVTARTKTLGSPNLPDCAPQRNAPGLPLVPGRQPTMSKIALHAVWEHFPRGGSDMLLALTFAKWCDDDGRSLHRSMSAIAKECRISRSQAQRIVHRLIAEGLIEVIANPTGGKPGTTPHYWLRFDRLTGSADATGRMDATGSADAPDGSHGCYGRGRTDATQSITSIFKASSNGADASSSRRPPPCPVQAIVDAYHQAMPFNPRVKVLNGARKRVITARWQEAAQLECQPFDGGYASQPDGMAKWREFFRVCARSTFLTGHAPPQPGRPPFIATIDFLLSPSGFAKCLENRYHREAS